ncbi:MAG: bifunctional phosphoglucose/phosphomannose isomerase [Candidatus Aenigmarchaeota archaeon]|nr:bifunctional phosphoglucose/phosphomannose isomerase [Candidatus Aenigmarchaeota archaeon]
MIDKMRKEFEGFPDQIESSIHAGDNILVSDIKKIIVAGVGGSSWPGNILETLLPNVDISLSRVYTIPDYCNEHTLVFVISYSGNTEEAIYSLNDALRKKCKVVCISSGGKLEEIALKNSLPYIKIQSGLEPRNSTGYIVVSMLSVLIKNNIASDIDLISAVNDIKTNDIESIGKTIASKLVGKIPLIYSSEKLLILSYAWKIKINENSKIHAFYNVLPELNHNEITGYTHLLGDFYTIIFSDRDDHERIKKRYSITKQIIEEKGGQCDIIETIGSNLFSRILCTLHIGDWVSYYLAKEYGFDPKPVDIIENLKKKLA